MTTFTVQRVAATKRQGLRDGTHEEDFPEPAVMLAFALHLLKRGARAVEIHPDGMHTKVYDIRTSLTAAGFSCETSGDRCVGSYARRKRTITVDFRSGVGDVVGRVNGTDFVAECKGGIVNTRHKGQKSRLRKGLCEAIGQLIGRERRRGERQVVVVPHTRFTLSIARRIVRRVNRAGIEIALVRPNGTVLYVTPARRSRR